MADNDYDPAGSTQMFRAFVDEGTNDPQTRSSSGGRTGLIVTVAVIIVAVVAVAAWLALK